MKILNIFALISFFLIGIEATAQVSTKKQTKKFQLIDTNGNEVISMGEMIDFYKDKTNKNGGSVNAIVLFSDLDANKNSIITLDEYLKGLDLKEGKKQLEVGSKKVQTNTMSAEQKKKKKFTRIDTDKNKVVTLKEMVDFNKGKRNKKGKQVESEVMFYGLDKNKDNMVTLEEFIQKVDWKFGRQRLKSINKKTN